MLEDSVWLTYCNFHILSPDRFPIVFKNKIQVSIKQVWKPYDFVAIFYVPQIVVIRHPFYLDFFCLDSLIFLLHSQSWHGIVFSPRHLRDKIVSLEKWSPVKLQKTDSNCRSSLDDETKWLMNTHWYMNNWTVVEVFWEQVCIDSCTHQHQAQVRPSKE